MNPASPTGPDVRAIEAWLEGLRGCGAAEDGAAEADDAPRTLFILDSDFGELTTILYLVLGQACLRNARILASPRIYSVNHDALPGRIAEWKTEADLVEALDAFRPRLVVLASGYLLPVHRLLKADAMERLCARARSDGAIVVTADPFLGLVSRCGPGDLPGSLSIAIPDTAEPALVEAKKMGDAMLHKGLLDAERLLRTAPHLYPSYTDREGIAPHETDGRNCSFFNAALVAPPHLAPRGDGKDGQPFWMFLIALVDWQTQCMFEGVDEFSRIVADRLADAVRLGRRAVLLAPSDLVERVRPLVPAGDGIALLGFCPFARVMALLLGAEHCFYWNAVSHSIIMPLWNGRSVFLFDRGHLLRAAPSLDRRVVAWYHQGFEPAPLDQKAGLSLASLEEKAQARARHRDEIMARYRRAPSPAAMLERLLDEAPEPHRP
ncbi:MAG TPA: hypothetical protein VGF77_03315 [Allosphingosinicella sp.]